MHTWHWLTQTDSGLLARVGVGTLILLALAVLDLRRNGRDATRWREYAFLLVAAMAALAYGLVNDQITARLSWEYFYYGKDLAAVLGPNVPPDPAGLHWEAARLSLKAAWTVGLIVGVTFLLANNPKPRLPRLTYWDLSRRLAVVLGCCVISAMMLGFCGYMGWLNGLSADFREMTRANQFRPRRFLMVFGIHLGGYVGGLAGTLMEAVFIRRSRARNRIGGMDTVITSPLERIEG